MIFDFWFEEMQCRNAWLVFHFESTSWARGYFDDGDLPARGDRHEWPWRGEPAGRDGRVSGLRVSCLAGRYRGWIDDDRLFCPIKNQKSNIITRKSIFPIFREGRRLGNCGWDVRVISGIDSWVRACFDLWFRSYDFWFLIWRDAMPQRMTRLSLRKHQLGTRIFRRRRFTCTWRPAWMALAWWARWTGWEGFRFEGFLLGGAIPWMDWWWSIVLPNQKSKIKYHNS